MRVCFVSYFGVGLWYAWKMIQDGHEVDLTVLTQKAGEEHFVTEPFKGLLPDERHDNAYQFDPASYDLVVFDENHDGEAADEVRQKIPTIGSSVLAERLEEDRLFGLDFMRKCGVQVPAYEAFDDPADGIRYIKKRDRRLVFKPLGNIEDKACTYVSKSPEDMLRYFDVLWRTPKVKEYVLQDFVEGCESATSVWVNSKGYCGLTHDTEVKKLMNGNLGPNNGCSGTLVWMPQRDTVLFAQGLKKCVEPLADMGYVGQIDLATISNGDGLWGLEFCPRFTYDGTQLFTRLLPMDFAEFLYAVTTGADLPDLTPLYGHFCAGVRLSIPPYPNELPDKFYIKTAGTPIEGLSEKDFDKFYVYDVKRREGSDEIETAGITGHIGTPLAVADTPGQAFEGAYEMLKNIQVPNAQYRTDICEDSCKRYFQLREKGWLKPA